MAEPKTKRTKASVTAFLERVPDAARRQDALRLLRIMKKAAKAGPTMWGSSIVGFGIYTYRYGSGRTGEWPMTGFSPRKQDLTLYIMPGFERYEAIMGRLGKYRTGKSCLYIKRLADVDLALLERLISVSVKDMRRYHSRWMTESGSAGSSRPV